MFKPPPGFNIIQKVSWYAGLVFATLATVTALALIFKLVVAAWRMIILGDW